MDRTPIFLVGLPIFLLCSDIINLFTPPPAKPTSHHVHVPPTTYQPQPRQPQLQQTLEFPVQVFETASPIGVGNTVNIDFCTSCSYKGTAVNVKNMLESSFPGINVVLANYPPPFPKQILSKVVPVVQLGIIAIIAAGVQILPRLGMAPPAWYSSLRANRFGSMASTWLFGNFIQSFLQSSGAFEVYCNGELVFSKLREDRFPGEIELRDLVSRSIANTRYV